MAAAAMVGGCGGEPEPKTAQAPAAYDPAPLLTPPQRQAITAAQKETGATGLGIEDEILRLCPVKPPRFAYDSAQVTQEFQNTLVALAECMNTGGLKGKDLLMVGHADPRGEEDYNMALGGRRAESVRTALGALGVAQTRLDVTSRGEVEATGTDEGTWSKDRRVDIKIKVN
jgi:peptidoglycan-associated lipoprotein